MFTNIVRLSWHIRHDASTQHPRLCASVSPSQCPADKRAAPDQSTRLLRIGSTDILNDKAEVAGLQGIERSQASWQTSFQPKSAARGQPRQCMCRIPSRPHNEGIGVFPNELGSPSIALRVCRSSRSQANSSPLSDARATASDPEAPPIVLVSTHRDEPSRPMAVNLPEL